MTMTEMTLVQRLEELVSACEADFMNERTEEFVDTRCSDAEPVGGGFRDGDAWTHWMELDQFWPRPPLPLQE